MFKSNSLLPALAISLALAPLVGPATVQAYPRGLIRSADFTQTYWVDRFGVSHAVPDSGMIPIYFKGDVIKEISWEEWMKIPKGGPIAAATPPEFYDTSSTRITMRAAGLPRAYNAQTTTSFRSIDTGLVAAPIVETKTVTTAAPIVETKTVTTAGPAVASSRIVQTFGAAPLMSPSATLELEDELLGTSATVEKRVEIVAPVITRKDQTFTRQSVVQKQVEVATPEVIQTRVEQLPSTAVVEKRVVTTVAANPVDVSRTVTTIGASPLNTQRTITTFGAAPLREQRTVTTIEASPIDTQRTVTTFGASPVNTSRTVTTYGAAPIREQRTVTTITQPDVEQRTVTTVNVDPLFSSHISYEVPTTTVRHTGDFLSTTEELDLLP